MQKYIYLSIVCKMEQTLNGKSRQTEEKNFWCGTLTTFSYPLIIIKKKKSQQPFIFKFYLAYCST